MACVAGIPPSLHPREIDQIFRSDRASSRSPIPVAPKRPSKTRETYGVAAVARDRNDHLWVAVRAADGAISAHEKSDACSGARPRLNEPPQHNKVSLIAHAARHTRPWRTPRHVARALPRGALFGLVWEFWVGGSLGVDALSCTYIYDVMPAAPTVLKPLAVRCSLPRRLLASFRELPGQQRTQVVLRPPNKQPLCVCSVCGAISKIEDIFS